MSVVAPSINDLSERKKGVRQGGGGREERKEGKVCRRIPIRYNIWPMFVQVRQFLAPQSMNFEPEFEVELITLSISEKSPPVPFVRVLTILQP